MHLKVKEVFRIFLQILMYRVANGKGDVRYSTDLTFGECRRTRVWSLAGRSRGDGGTNALKREAGTKDVGTKSTPECI